VVGVTMSELHSGFGPYYPDDTQGWQVCIMEGCAGPNCSRCGNVNYAWLGFLGAMARLAKKWGVSRDEAEARWTAEQEAKFGAIWC